MWILRRSAVSNLVLSNCRTEKRFYTAWTRSGLSTCQGETVRVSRTGVTPMFIEVCPASYTVLHEEALPHRVDVSSYQGYLPDTL